MSTIAPAKHTLFINDLERVLQRTRSGWEQLRGQRLFVTGGTGFFGKWFLETFAFVNDTLRLNSEITVLSRDPRLFAVAMPHLADRADIRFHAGDIRDFDFPTGDYSHVIHAATEASARLNEQSPETMFDVVVEGTRRTLAFARHCGAARLLLVSSGAVYGQQPPETTHVPEEYVGGPDPLSPSCAYGEGKRVAEMLGSMAHRQHGLEVAIARCFAFVGPYLPLNEHFAIGNFLRDALADHPIVVQGDGRPVRSYMYAGDLAVWLWTILFHGKPCRPYNVGSDQPFSIREIAHAVAAVGDPPLEVRIAAPPDAAKPVSYYVPSIERARRELGLEVETGLHEAIARTFLWHRPRGAAKSF